MALITWLAVMAPAEAVPILGVTATVEDCSVELNGGGLMSNTKTGFQDTSLSGSSPSYSCVAGTSPIGPSTHTDVSADNSGGAASSILMVSGTTLAYEFAISATGAPPGAPPSQIPFTVDWSGAASASASGAFASAWGSAGMSVATALGGVGAGFNYTVENGVDQGCTPTPGPCSGAGTLTGLWAEPGTTYAIQLRVSGQIDIIGVGQASYSAAMDPVVQVDPSATFGAGLHYTDYYDVAVAGEVTQGVPEPETAWLLVLGLAGLVRLRRGGRLRLGRSRGRV